MLNFAFPKTLVTFKTFDISFVVNVPPFLINPNSLPNSDIPVLLLSVCITPLRSFFLELAPCNSAISDATAISSLRSIPLSFPFNALFAVNSAKIDLLFLPTSASTEDYC